MSKHGKLINMQIFQLSFSFFALWHNDTVGVFVSKYRKLVDMQIYLLFALISLIVFNEYLFIYSAQRLLKIKNVKIINQRIIIGIFIFGEV